MGKYSTPVTYQTAQKTRTYAQPMKKEYAPLDWSRVDVASEIERHTSTRLNKKGNTQLVGACPFDDCSVDTDGFVVWPDMSSRGQHFYCRGCGRNGDLIALLREIHPDWSFPQTLIEIGMRDKDEGSETPIARPSSQWDREKAERDAWFASQLELLQTYYPAMQKALLKFDRPGQYLASRGIRLEDAQRYGLGYFPLREESGHKIDDAHLTKWFGRLIFPLSGQGKGVTFAGRTLQLWTPDMSPYEHKKALDAHNERFQDTVSQQIRRTLKTSPCGNFGYDEAMQRDHIVVCEGEFDALSLQLAGIENVVAMGTSLPIKSIPLRVEKVTLALDTDAPGAKAAKKLAFDLADRGIEVTTTMPPAAKDWNEAHILGGLAAIAEVFAAKPVETLPTQEVTVAAGATVYLDDDEEEPLEPLLCSRCGKQDTPEDLSFFRARNGKIYCSPTCEKSDSTTPAQPVRAVQPEISKEDRIKAFARSVSGLASMLGPDCKIDSIGKNVSMRAWLERKYPDARIYDLDEYLPVTLPALPRKKCPHMTVEILSAKNGGNIKQWHDGCHSATNEDGWCPDHKLSHLFLCMGAMLGYPCLYVGSIDERWGPRQDVVSLVEPDRFIGMIIGSGVANWEGYAEHATGERLIKLLPHLKTMIETE